MSEWSVTVPEGTTRRLDTFLGTTLGISRHQVRRLFEAAEVIVNGRPAKKGITLKPGDMIRIENLGQLHPLAEPNCEMPLEVIYEDTELLAVNKPAGVPSVAIHQKERGTVASAILARYPENSALPRGNLEAGLVQRLDAGTSGVIVAARTVDAYANLRQAFSQGLVRKYYLAVVTGRVERAGTIDLPLTPSGRQSKRITVWRTSSRKPRLAACTRYRPLAYFSEGTMLAITIRTGVRHQIRAHLAAINHPILGDTLYGCSSSESPQQHPVFLLHARRIVLPHPAWRRNISISAPCRVVSNTDVAVC